MPGARAGLGGKLCGLCVLLPLLSIADNLVAITTGSLLVAAIVFEIRGELDRSDVAFVACSVIIGLDHGNDRTAGVAPPKPRFHMSTFIPRVGRVKPPRPKDSQLR